MDRNSKNKKDTRRKRPEQERSIRTVEKILSSTLFLLKQNASSGLNTNLIAKSAGIGVGTIYQYFPSKESILNELVEKYFGDQDRKFYQYFQNLEASLPIKALVEKLIDKFYELLSESASEKLVLKGLDIPDLKARIENLDKKMLLLLSESFTHRFSMSLDMNQFSLTVEAIKGMNDYYFRYASEHIELNEVKQCAKKLIFTLFKEIRP